MPSKNRVAKSGEPKITTEMIGPGEAQEILDNHNQGNRTISAATVAQYARAMHEGRWPFIGDPIRFDRNNMLRDGQHRLAAVVASGCPQTFVIVRNLEPDAQRFMDGGRKRTAGDQLRIEGMTNPTACASVARLVMHWQRNDIPTFSTTFSTAEVVEFVETNLDMIDVAALAAKRLYGATRAPQATSGATLFMGSQVTDVDTALKFTDQLTSGAGLAEGSPILLLRHKLMAWASQSRVVRRDRGELVYCFARTWNAWRRGETLLKLQLPKGSTLSATHMRLSS